MSDKLTVGRIEQLTTTPPRGEPIPQTVDSLQAVMAKDAVLMEQQGQEISKLKQKNNQLRQKNAALQQENEALKAAINRAGAFMSQGATNAAIDTLSEALRDD